MRKEQLHDFLTKITPAGMGVLFTQDDAESLDKIMTEGKQVKTTFRYDEKEDLANIREAGREAGAVEVSASKPTFHTSHGINFIQATVAEKHEGSPTLFRDDIYNFALKKAEEKFLQDNSSIQQALKKQE